MLRKLGLENARDVIFFFPRDYQDLTDLSSVGELQDDTLVRLHGTVVELDQRHTSSGGTILGALIQLPGRARPRGVVQSALHGQAFACRTGADCWRAKFVSAAAFTR